MKVAVVAPTYIPAQRANTIQVMKMAQALSMLGHNLRLAVPGVDDDTASPSWQELAHQYGLEHEFPVEWLPARPQFRRYDYGMRAVRWARAWRAEVLYTRLPQAAALASLLGMPTILELHDYPQGRMGPILFRIFLKGSGARRLVVITRALALELNHELGAPGAPPFVLIAPDGVDMARYAQVPSSEAARQRIAKLFPEHLLQEEQFVAGYTGNLYQGRGVGLLLDIAAYLPGIKFLIVGGEPQDVNRLRNEVKSRGLENIILTGFVPNADLPDYQAACDVLLMPYQKRVAASSGGNIAPYLSPMKLFEYLACGRAILSSDLPVLQEVLNQENAVLLPPEEKMAWVDALQGLRADPQRCATLGTQARREAGIYTWEGRAERIIAELDEDHA
jgi:glycosyltransferase involved in cell wall biosynthesis